MAEKNNGRAVSYTHLDVYKRQDMECAYYPESRTLIVINNTDSVQETTINTEFGTEKIKLEAFDTLIKKI